MLESSRASLRGVLRGIAGYARLHGPWTIYHYEETSQADTLDDLKHWGAQGVIGPIKSARQLERLQQLDLPVVDILGQFGVEEVSASLIDEWRVAQLAARHLLERGFEHFGYCGLFGVQYSADRRRHFVSTLRDAGYEVSVHNGPSVSRKEDFFSVEFEGQLQQHASEYAAWIKALPKPVGLMACNDVRARHIVDACTDYGVAVPEEVAVIGVDNDDLVCELSDPTLSSVKTNSYLHGHEAAALLHKIVEGRRSLVERVQVEPLGVVTRRSTDVLAIADSYVATAVHFIREHFRDGITVREVLSRVPLSRSTLERRFNKVLGRSPKAEILRLQIEHVQKLLSSTDFPLLKVAHMAGFSYASHMCEAFKEKTGFTPGQYRKRSQAEQPQHE
ncbi:MAG: DNA-binding transcriptional regulator [Planctomycetota bacterium]|nr:DNA-binding transcriptional regulator [Planctomycetota bacterium]